MLHINFINNQNPEKSFNAIKTAVEYEKNLMQIDYNNDKIKALNVIMNSQSRSEPEKEKAWDNINLLESQNNALSKKNKANKATYETIINTIAGAKNEYTQNNKESARNLFRLLASAENKKLVKYVLLTDFDYEYLYNTLMELHEVSEKTIAENGLRKRTKENDNKAHALFKELQKIFYDAFSIPVVNEYTDKMTIKLNKTTVAWIHETFIENAKKKIQNTKDETLVKDRVVKAKITKTVKNGKTIYNGEKFKQQICEEVYDYITDKKANQKAIDKRVKAKTQKSKKQENK